MADKRLAISDDVVLEPTLPRPSICVKGKAKREFRARIRWRLCKC